MSMASEAAFVQHRPRSGRSTLPDSRRRDAVIFDNDNSEHDKEGIAEVLEQIATLLELKDENPFKIRAYTNAARSIETWGGNLGD